MLCSRITGSWNNRCILRKPIAGDVPLVASGIPRQALAVSIARNALSFKEEKRPAKGLLSIELKCNAFGPKSRFAATTFLATFED